MVFIGRLNFKRPGGTKSQTAKSIRRGYEAKAWWGKGDEKSIDDDKA